MRKQNGILAGVSKGDLKLLQKKPQKFWEGVTKIGCSAFRNCSKLTSVEIPEGVTKIGEFAFCNCSGVTSIEIPGSVKEIAGGAFVGCENLESFEVEEGSVYKTSEDKRCLIEDGKLVAFASAGLTEYTIPEGVTEIGDSAFWGSLGLTSIEIPGSVTKIGDSAFKNCSGLTSIKIPEGVTEIGSYAFSHCSELKSITIPGSVTEIGTYAFADSSGVTSIKISEGVTKISDSAFWDCSGLTSIEIPGSVTEIGAYAFWGCSGLRSITIPESVTEISYSAFIGYNGSLDLIVNGKSHAIHTSILNCIEFEEVKGMIREGADFKAYNALIKKLGGEKELEENTVELIKLGKVLGLFEPKNVTTKINGKQVPVRDVAYTLLQNILITNKLINVNNLHAELSGLEDGNYCEAFLKFMSNKTNCDDLVNNLESFPQIVSWFRSRQALPTLNGNVQEAGDDPTIEENRYKVYRYSLGENGVYKDRWNAPTVQFIKEELAEKKYTGITPDKKHIATALSAISAYKEQKFYDKASEIEDERRNLVEEGKLSNHILKTPLKQDLIEALDKYRERTKNLANQIVENCAEACETNVETANKLFTYEMLSKDSEEIYVMGFNTSCCARLFGAGGGAQRASILHPDVQPLVIRDSRGEMIAMSLIYVNREKGYAVANDVEVNNKYNGKDSIRREIYNKFIEGVDAFVKQYNREDPTRKPITKVHCGVSPNWTTINDFIQKNPEGEILKAVDFSNYQYNGQGTYSGDWQKRQWVIWSKEGQGHEQ